MENMISRYRDRLMNSSSELKTLSASRQKYQQNKNKYQIHHTQKNQQKQSKNQQKHQQKQKQKHQQKSQQNLKQKQRLPPKHQTLNTLQLSRQKQQKLSHTNLKSSRKQTILSSSKSHQKLPSKRTPKKPPTPTPTSLNQSYSQSIYQLLTQQKNIYLINKPIMKDKIKIFLQEYFNKRIEIINVEQLVMMSNRSKVNKNVMVANLVQMNKNNEIYANSNSNGGYFTNNMLESKNYMIQSQNRSNNINHNNNSNPTIPQLSTSHLPLTSNQFFQSQLEHRYLQCQKQRQYYKNKLQSLTKKSQSLQKQLQKYNKIQKLIHNTIETQNQTRKQIIRLRKQLDVSQLKNIEQQKIFKKQINIVKDIVDSLKKQLKGWDQITNRNNLTNNNRNDTSSKNNNANNNSSKNNNINSDSSKKQ